MSQRSELEKDALCARHAPDWPAHTAMLRALLNGDKGTGAQRAAVTRILKQLMDEERKDLNLAQNIRSALKTKERLPI